MNLRSGFLLLSVLVVAWPSGALALASKGGGRDPSKGIASTFEVGGSLVANCRHGEPQTHYCIGYVVGIIDMAKLLYLSSGDDRLRLCLDGSLTLAQLADRVVDEIAKNQEAIDESAILGVLDALRRCLIPWFDGAISAGRKDALWARFFMGAPQRRRWSVERYSIVKRA